MRPTTIEIDRLRARRAGMKLLARMWRRPNARGPMLISHPDIFIEKIRDKALHAESVVASVRLRCLADWLFWNM